MKKIASPLQMKKLMIRETASYSSHLSMHFLYKTSQNKSTEGGNSSTWYQFPFRNVVSEPWALVPHSISSCSIT